MAGKKTTGNSGSGSPMTGEPEYLLVGFLRRPYGLRGELVMDLHTDFPERLKSKTKVFVGDSHKPMVIERARLHNNEMWIKFTGLDTPEDAGRHRNQSVYVRTADCPPLPEGYFYEHQLIGFGVVGEKNEIIGMLSEIMRTGANDVYIVKRADETEVLLPVIPSVVLKIDAANRVIHVHLIPGLIEDGES